VSDEASSMNSPAKALGRKRSCLDALSDATIDRSEIAS